MEGQYSRAQTIQDSHESFLTWVTEEPVKGSALLNLMLTEKEKLVTWFGDIHLDKSNSKHVGWVGDYE